MTLEVNMELFIWLRFSHGVCLFFLLPVIKKQGSVSMYSASICIQAWIPMLCYLQECVGMGSAFSFIFFCRASQCLSYVPGRRGETSVVFPLLFLAPALAIMLVALCFTVASWPVKTLTCYKMISWHTWVLGTKRWFEKECEPSVLPAPPVDRFMDRH